MERIQGSELGNGQGNKEFITVIYDAEQNITHLNIHAKHNTHTYTCMYILTIGCILMMDVDFLY